MEKEIMNIIHRYHDSGYMYEKLVDLFKHCVGIAFDAGFNITDERFNGEFRDCYGLFDEVDYKRYAEEKEKFINDIVTRNNGK